jgi:hypothetical protein
MPGFFSVMLRLLLLTFVTFVTACNFDKLLFTVGKGQGEGFYSLCDGGKGAG